MSEPEKFVIPSIKHESTTQIKVSGFFYSKLTALYYNILSKYKEEDIIKIIGHITSGTIKDLPEDKIVDYTSIQTLLILIKTIEDSFGKEKKITNTDFIIPTEDSV